MFLIRWLKKLLTLALIVLAIAWFAEHTTVGKKVTSRISGFFKSELFKEGVKDLKVLTGEVLKGVGDKIQEGVTQEEQRELDELFKQKLAPETQRASTSGATDDIIKKGKTGIVPSDRGATTIKGSEGSMPKTTMAKPIQLKRRGE